MPMEKDKINNQKENLLLNIGFNLILPILFLRKAVIGSAKALPPD